MSYIFQTEQWLPFPPEAVFDFFSNPENLPRLMPRWQHARIEEANLRPPPPRPPSSVPQRGVAAGSGTRMTLSFRAFPLSPIRIPWEAEIVDFVWNDHFCDIQHRGPFKSWKHCHSIRPEVRNEPHFGAPNAGTLLRDHVTYEAPFGIFGPLANALVIRHQLRSMFRYRHRRTAELLPLFTRGA